jgi:molecular chaperone HtpG
MTQTAQPAEKLEFRTELKQLLHIITHSLYSNKEIFLRELISNASDAINKIKFDSLQHEELLEGNKDWKIQITADRAAGTLTVSDNGIGLSREDAIDNLGTIAKSGTRAFLESLKNQNAQTRPDMIGQFGVGFYSSFMVADRVTVVSRRAGVPADQAVKWSSDGQGDFTVETVEKASRGTDVTLHLKEDEKDFLQEYRLRGIVKKFSDFIEHPVVMDVEQGSGEEKKTVEETLNARKAIWLRPKAENTPEEYAEFYKQITGDPEAPAKVIHYTAEGAQEFKVLVFIPSRRPFELQWGDYKAGLRLYVQRVLIMDRCEELLPGYLRFVRGVVDSSDLPLNISREMLQHNPLLDKIRSNVVRSVLKALEEMKADEYDKYVSFYKELGEVLKEGVGRDWDNRQRLADLLLFESLKTPAGQYTTLARYFDEMPAEQKDIYYLIGESRELLEQSPYLEAFRSRGWDVLLLSDPIDEFALPNLHEYKGKKLKAADRGELDDDKAARDKREEAQGSYKKLFEALKGKLSEVADVRLSSRLKESAACLVADEGAMTAHMERLLQRMGRDTAGAARRVLELNGEHPAVVALHQLFEKLPEDPRVENYARLLYDQAVIAEGSKVKDPVAFARRVNELLVKDAASAGGPAPDKA